MGIAFGGGNRSMAGAVGTVLRMDASTDIFLRRLPVLTGLDDDALQFLAGLARDVDYGAGEMIVREGEPGDRVYLVRSGRVRVFKGSGGGAVVDLAEFGPGDFFGEMSLVECVVRSASVVAVEPTSVSTLKGSDFYRLYRQRPDQYGIVILNIARDLARRLRHLDEHFCHVTH